MKTKLIAICAVATMVLVVNSTALATLTTVGTGTIVGGGSNSYKLIYDDAQDITWLDYYSFVNGWDVQLSWAANLEVSFEGQTLDQWRLPSPGTNPQVGYELTGSEMGHLYYESLGKKIFGPLGDTTPFENLQVGVYWNSEAADEFNIWCFQTSDGLQVPGYINELRCGIAVMDGQVPEPATLSLLALGGLALLRRRRTA